MPDALPIIDLESLDDSDGPSLSRIAADVGAACRDVGFFYVVNHGVDGEPDRRSLRPVARLFRAAGRRQAGARDRGGRRQSRLFRPPA